VAERRVGLVERSVRSWFVGGGHRLMPLPPHLWHRTTLSPFLSVPFPSQFLHFCFFWAVFFCMVPSYAARWIGRGVQSVPLAYAHGSQGRDRSGWLGAGIGPEAAGCAPGPTRSPVIAASPERPHMGGQLQ
jgi:hypothetical protein